MKKIVVLLIYCFICLLLTASPVLAGICGAGSNQGYECCPRDNCYADNNGPQDCIQTPKPQVCCGSCRPSTENGDITNPVIGIFGTQPGNLTIAYLFATILKLALIGAGLMLLISLISAGLQWMSSSGEKTSVAAARDKITNAFIGLILIVLVLVIIAIVNEIFKINILKPEIPTP